MRWLERSLMQGPYLALCLSQREFEVAARKVGHPVKFRRFVSHGKGGTTHTIHTENGLVCLVCLEIPPKTPLVEVHGLLLHEAVHVWQEQCRDIGEESPGDEAEAYAIQVIAQELFKEYGRRK
jgi:hypothetical protein